MLTMLTAALYYWHASSDKLPWCDPSLILCQSVFAYQTSKELILILICTDFLAQNYLIAMAI